MQLATLAVRLSWGGRSSGSSYAHWPAPSAPGTLSGTKEGSAQPWHSSKHAVPAPLATTFESIALSKQSFESIALSKTSFEKFEKRVVKVCELYSSTLGTIDRHPIAYLRSNRKRFVSGSVVSVQGWLRASRLCRATLSP